MHPWLTLICLCMASTIRANDDSDIPPLTSRDYLQSAVQDADRQFGLSLATELDQLEFSVFHGFFEDLDDDGQSELIVAGDIVGKNIYYVLAYRWDEDRWRCEVLNRARGGGIHIVQLIDCDNDGRSEIFSVLNDEDGRKFCSVYSFSTQSRSFVPVFEMETESGFQCSYNFMLFHPEGSRQYRLRIDKAVYPEDEGGQVKTKTEVYGLRDGRFHVLNENEGK